jgi:hypothetical protein
MTVITVPNTREGRLIARELGRLAVIRPVAVDGDCYGHVYGDNAEGIVRALRESFSDLVWNVAHGTPTAQIKPSR